MNRNRARMQMKVDSFWMKTTSNQINRKVDVAIEGRKGMHCTRLKAHDVIEGRNYVYNLPRCKSTKYMFSPVLRLVFLPHKFISFPISLRGESNGCPPPYICCVAVTVWRERVASCHPDGKRPWLYSMAGTPSPFFVWFACRYSVCDFCS